MRCRLMDPSKNRPPTAQTRRTARRRVKTVDREGAYPTPGNTISNPIHFSLRQRMKVGKYIIILNGTVKEVEAT